MNTITETIKVPSLMLSQNIKQNILSLLRSTKEGFCTKKYGCVLKIVELIDIVEAIICIADKTNHFKVVYSFDSFLPEINVEYSGYVFRTYPPEGMIIVVAGCISIKILVSSSGRYSTGDEVRLIIRELEFISDSFMGVGDVV